MLPLLTTFFSAIYGFNISSTADTAMPSTHLTTQSPAETSIAFTEPVVTTESPFLVCIPFVIEEEISQRPDLDYTKEQMGLWWKAEIDCQTTDDICINGYTLMLNEIIASRELILNSEKTLRDKCWDKGIYMKLTFSLNGLSENKVSCNVLVDSFVTNALILLFLER